MDHVHGLAKWQIQEMTSFPAKYAALALKRIKLDLLNYSLLCILIRVSKFTRPGSQQQSTSNGGKNKGWLSTGLN
jgi:hypothetical protein